MAELPKSVTQQSVGNWEEEFAESTESGLPAFPPGFTPPIYNVWKQQTKTNAVSHFGNSEVDVLLRCSAGVVFGGGLASRRSALTWSLPVSSLGRD